MKRDQDKSLLKNRGGGALGNMSQQIFTGWKEMTEAEERSS